MALINSIDTRMVQGAAQESCNAGAYMMTIEPPMSPGSVECKVKYDTSVGLEIKSHARLDWLYADEDAQSDASMASEMATHLPTLRAFLPAAPKSAKRHTSK